MIYLDNNASTRTDERVLEAMLPWFRDHWANPANILHREGRLAREAIRSAQEEIGEFIGCSPEEIVFTGGATEANLLAVAGARPGGGAPESLVTSTIEHPSTWTLALRLESRGLRLSTVEPNARGFVSGDGFERLELTDNSLVSLQWVNSETGIVNDVAAIADLVKAKGALLHVDAAQALGRVPLDLARCPIDLLTLSAHKSHGPKGIGALFVRKGVIVEPGLAGGSRPKMLRAGTPNVPGAVGFGAACRILRDEAERDNERIGALRDMLEHRIRADLEDTVTIGGGSPRVANTSMLGWKGLDNRDIARALDEAGICAGSGAACSTEDPFGSRSLRAMRIDPEVVPSCIRFSLGRENRPEEIAEAADRTVEIVRGLRTP